MDTELSKSRATLNNHHFTLHHHTTAYDFVGSWGINAISPGTEANDKNSDYLFALMGRKFFLHPDDVTRLNERITGAHAFKDVHIKIRVISIAGEMVELEAIGHFERRQETNGDSNEQLTTIKGIERTQYATLRYRHALDILDAMHEACFQLDHEGTITYVNKRAQTIFHLHKHELLGRNIWAVFPESEESSCYQVIQEQALNNNEFAASECKSSVLKTWISLSATPAEDGCTVLLRTLENYHDHHNGKDVSVEQQNGHHKRELPDEHERIKGDELSALKQSNILLEGIAQSQGTSLNALRAVRDEENNIIDFEWLFANGASKKFARRQELVGRRYLEVFPKLASSGIFEQYRHVIESGEPHDYEFRTYDNGLYNWYRSVTVKLGDGVLVTTEDITPRKKAEQDLVQSSSILQSIYDSLPIGISLLVPQYGFDGSIYDFKIKKVNRELERETRRYDLIGKLYLHEYPGVRAVGLLEMMLRVIETGVTEQLEYFYPHEGFNKWFSSMMIKTYDGLLATNIDITARKVASEEMEKNYQILRQTEEVAGIGSWDYVIASNQLRWSDGMYKLFNIPNGTPVRPEIYADFMVDEEQPLAEKIIRHFKADHRPFEETICIKADGHNRTLRVKGLPLFDGDGTPTRIIGIDHDISAIKKSEHDLMEQHQRLLEAQALGQLGSYELDVRTNQVYWSDELYRMMGVEMSDPVTLESALAHYLPEDAQKLAELAKQSIDSGEGFELEASYKRTNESEIRNVLIISKVVKNAAGRVVKIRGVAQDVTERKKASVEIIRMQEMLAQSATDKYQQLFNSIDEGFCIIEMIFDDQGRPVDYRFIEANPAFRKQTGHSDLLGKTIRSLHAKPDHRSIELYEHVIRTSHSVRFVQQDENSEKWFDVFAFPAQHAQANAVGILLHDITKRKQAEQELKQLYSELRKADQEKTEFFSNISHEFRTPLTLILGPLADVIDTSSQRLNLAQHDKLQLIRRNVVRLQKLVNTLLDFSRIEGGQMDAVFQPTDIARFTQDIAANFRSAIEESGLKYIVKCEDPGEPVYLNRTMYEKIVLNLLSNAFKFTFEGKIELRIRAKAKKVELRVLDTGVGISAANQGRIFQRFIRIENSKSRTFEGSGIGLALVREMVNIHHGQITVKSEAGKGSTFMVSFLRGKDHLEKDKIFESTDELSSSSVVNYLEEIKSWQYEPNDGKRIKAADGESSGLMKPIILVADDNVDMRHYLTSILEPRYKVIKVENGQKAIEVLKAGLLPDLVLTDVMMPEKDGYDVLTTIKRHEIFKQIPVILLTAQGRDEEKVEGLEYGADDYIVKPFSSRELVARIDARIQVSAIRKQSERKLTDANKTLEKVVAERSRALMETNESLMRNNRALTAMNDELSSLTFAASHDLREPLRKLSFYLLKILSMEEVTLPEHGKEYLEKIEASIKLMSDLLAGLSMYTYFNAKPIEREMISLSDVLQEVTQSLSGRLQETETTIKINVADGLHGDKNQIRQLLSNLLSNALKFRQRDKAPNISISGKIVPGEILEHPSADKQMAYYELRVGDNGIGFAQEYEKQIFHLFRKLHTRSQYPGTGIGLTIVNRIVHNHDGFIVTRSKPDKGTQFVMYFPVAPSADTVSVAERQTVQN